MPHKTKIDAEEKVRIVQLYLSGKKGLEEAAREVGVDCTALKDWIAI